MIDMICAIEGITKDFCSNAIANEFKHECKNVLKKGRKKKDINVTEKVCRGLRTWLNHNKIVLIENDKGRATCLIKEEKLTSLIEKELENKERYKELFKDNIEKVKSETNKELAKLRKEKLLTIEELNNLKQITPTTPVARPTLKTHKDP